MKKKHFIPFFLPVAVWCLTFLAGCQPTLDCGTWAFNGTAAGNGFGSSYNVNSAFTFNPADCGSNCNVTTDCIVQMVSIYNYADQDYQYPNSGQQERSAAYGWSIDQIDGWAYGYYSLNNDGKTFDDGYNPPGSNGVATTLYDVPGGWGPNIDFFSVDVAVSFNTKSCNNAILGYYFWCWTIDSNGNPSGAGNAPAWKDLDGYFQNAVAGWNTWAPLQGSQNEGVPGQPIDPTCYPFPKLTDL